MICLRCALDIARSIPSGQPCDDCDAMNVSLYDRKEKALTALGAYTKRIIYSHMPTEAQARSYDRARRRHQRKRALTKKLGQTNL